MLIWRKLKRSTNVPPNAPAIASGRTAKAPDMPVRAALPVISSTSHGTVIAVSMLPTVEIALADSSA